MKFKEYEIVRLVKPLEGLNIPVGTRGVIVTIYESNPEKYEVEFVNDANETIGLATVSSEFLNHLNAVK